MGRPYQFRSVDAFTPRNSGAPIDLNQSSRVPGHDPRVDATTATRREQRRAAKGGVQ